MLTHLKKYLYVKMYKYSVCFVVFVVNNKKNNKSERKAQVNKKGGSARTLLKKKVSVSSSSIKSRSGKKIKSIVGKQKIASVVAAPQKRKESAAVKEAKLVADEKALRLATEARASVSEPSFLEFISRNVGTRANDIISTLISGPLVDDKIAETLSLKLNETRRMLNVLNTYGLVRYNINKNSEGWLSFIWYIDFESISGLDAKIKASAVGVSLPDGCNDFFICSSCSKTHKIVLPFEVAFDNKFRCTCGKKLDTISRADAEKICMTAIA